MIQRANHDSAARACRSLVMDGWAAQSGRDVSRPAAVLVGTAACARVIASPRANLATDSYRSPTGDRTRGDGAVSLRRVRRTVRSRVGRGLPAAAAPPRRASSEELLCRGSSRRGHVRPLASGPCWAGSWAMSGMPIHRSACKRSSLPSCCSSSGSLLRTQAAATLATSMACWVMTVWTARRVTAPPQRRS